MAKVNGWAFDVEILYLCARFGWRVDEVPVKWAHAAGSKIRPMAYLHVLADVAVLRVRHRRTVRPEALRPADEYARPSVT
jgi:dolichyl-phosphate beta-glucosyltransferase